MESNIKLRQLKQEGAADCSTHFRLSKKSTALKEMLTFLSEC
ncbi:MAG: hypothetical protein Q4D26_02810 [Clostridia bacterium]|nr:hypothetical protein [Clostridia bacterium]